jgi:hypothetical protein
MRKFLAAATTALTLSVIGLSAPAFADHNTTPAPTPGYGGNGSQYGQPYDDSDDGRGNYGQGERGRHSYNFDQNDDRGFDGWERGWQREGGYGYERHGVLPYYKLIRRLERQGYYDVRGLRQSRWGFGLRAFAFTGRGLPVMLRVNPYTGQVMDVRFVGRGRFRHGGW